MKIAHLIAQFYPYVGGAEICVHNVCRTLTQEEHHAMVISTTPKPSSPVDLHYATDYLWNRTCGLLRRIPWIGRKYLFSELSKLQNQHSFDLWQVTGGYPLGVYAADFFKQNKIPCVLRCCGEDIQKYPQINYGYRLDPAVDELARREYPKYDGHVALTPTVEKEYHSLGIPESKIRIIPNGADFTKFEEMRSDTEQISKLRKKFNIGDKKLILTTGRYHPKKGFDLIPDIAKKLNLKKLDFVWLIAGNGCCEIREKFPECDELGIICSDDFTKSESGPFNLPPESLIGLYCASDIYVLPTLIETFGMVLVEAMAAGLPIITTDAPGVNDVIKDGVNGIKVPVKNNDLMANKIFTLFEDYHLSAELAKNSLEMAKNTYDWNIVTKQYIDFYRKIITQVHE